MNKVLEDIMDWPMVEAVIYSECDDPVKVLGPQIRKEGVLIQCFMPDAKEVSVKVKDKKTAMEKVDEAGFFAVLLPRKRIPEYTYETVYEDGTVVESEDAYAFLGAAMKTVFDEENLKSFHAGINYNVYDKLGAHPAVIDNTRGVYFAVWAPMALRVSVVGDFNLWDGRRNPMQRRGEYGVHELFVPGLTVGSLYKFEIKTKSGNIILKADPYANQAQLRPDTASVVADVNDYEWQDREWMRQRKTSDWKQKPLNIYELHLGSWKKPEDGREFYNYRELAAPIADYVKEMGYTYIELMPVMEHPFDASWGYQVTGYYAPTSRYGTPQDFMHFIDYMHSAGIGVILDWVPAHFPKDDFGLACFDGTCLYEHKDPRQGVHPHWGTLIYNYKRPEVSNFLIANAIFWADKFHADGFRVDAVASMLYLDYGKSYGEWIPNIYGGNENLDAIEFFKHLNSILKKRRDGLMLIAEESTAWPEVTTAVEEGGLGFDYKWNMGWMNDFLQYMKIDPYFRSGSYNLLTFSMIYAYSEDFILSLSHDEVVHGKATLLGKMPGDTLEKKAANLRAAYAFMITHPGKKLLFMGQEIGQLDEWYEAVSVEWELLQYPVHSQMKSYVKALNTLYRSEKALYEKDFSPEGFEWINCISANENILVFLRKTDRVEDTLLVVCNFAPVLHEDYKIGVPYPGKYKEIFNSENKAFGGSGDVNPRLKVAKKDECDGRENSMRIKAAPLGVSVFRYMPVVEKVTDNDNAVKNRKNASKKTGRQVERIRKQIMEENQ